MVMLEGVVETSEMPPYCLLAFSLMLNHGPKHTGKFASLG